MPDIVQKFTIAADGAIKAIKSVADGLGDYNERVKDGTKVQKAYNERSQQTKDLLRELNSALRAVAPDIERMNEHVDVASRRFRSLATAAVNSKAEFIELQGAAREVRSKFGAVSDAALKLQTDLQNTAAAGRGFKTAIQNDTDSILRNTAVLRDFGTEMRRITASMKLKNLTMEQQVEAGKKDEAQTVVLGGQYELLAKIILGSLVRRAITQLILALKTSAQEAIEFNQRLAEIQTVSLSFSGTLIQNSKTTREWGDELLSLSRNFGIPVIQATEAAYQALSNQVVNATNVTAFMRQEIKLAATTQATLQQAVQVTSTVINAYHKTASEAAEINAVLFQGVVLGRFRLEELGSSFGKAVVLASQLGVSLEEVVGSLATLTRLGLQADAANTLLINVFNALIKPTKELTEVFRSWGFESGQAAIANLGFAKTFTALNAEVSKSNDRLGALAQEFHNLRGLVGAAGLAGNLKLLEDSIDGVTNKAAVFNFAFTDTMENIGKETKINIEKMKQLMLIEFGEPLIKLLNSVSAAFGGADHALHNFVVAVRIGSEILIGYNIAQGVVAISTGKMVGLVKSLTVAKQELNAIEAIANAKALATSVAMGAVTFGITALTVVIGELIAKELTAAQTSRLMLIELRSNLIEQATKDLEVFSENLGNLFKPFEKATDDTFKKYGNFLANLRQQNDALVTHFDKTFKEIHKSIHFGLHDAVENAHNELKELGKNVERLQHEIDQRKNVLVKEKEDAQAKDFEANLPEDPQKRIVALEQEKQRLFDEGVKKRIEGENKVADAAFKRVAEIDAEQERLIKKLLKDAAQLENIGKIRRDDKGNISVEADDGAGGKKTVTLTQPPVKRPKGGVRVGVDEVVNLKEQKDQELAEKAAKALLLLEQERADQAERRLAAEEEGLAILEQQKQKAEEELKTRQKAFDQFKNTLAQLDAIRPKDKDAIEQLKTLLDAAQKQGKAAGIDPTSLLNFTRQANALEIELIRNQEAEKRKERLDALDATLKAQQEKQKQAIEEEKKLEKQAFEARQKIAQEATLAAQRVEDRIKNLHAPITELRSFTNDPDSETKEERNIRRFGELKNEALQRIATIKQLSAQLLQQQRDNQDTTETVNKLAEAEQRLNKVLQALPNLTLRNNNLIGPNKPKLSPKGEILLDEEKGKVQQSVNDVVKDQLANFAVLKDTYDKLTKARNDYNQALKDQQLLESELAKLPKNLVEKNVAVENLITTTKEQHNLNNELSVTLARLQAINAEFARLPRNAGAAAQQANGGTVFRAHGGQGTDVISAMLTKGETVMTRLATRQYAPILRAMNATPPRANGGSVVNNIGDVHIHTPAGTTNLQVMEIGRQLQRLTRQGRL